MANTECTAYNPNWLNRQEECIAQGALTNSKRPESLIKGVYPTHLTRGLGCHVWDSDGKKYIDYICGLGVNLLGYGHEEIAETVLNRIRRGATLSLSTTTEVRLAELLKGLFPCIESLKFLKTGSDACNAAIRIARAYTGRDYVLSEGYHGWSDEFMGLTPPAFGVVCDSEHMGCLTQKDINPKLMKEMGVAAVIVEPIILNNSEEHIEWLRSLRQACTEAGTVLIFDEVITGFRYKNLSVSKRYSIKPDLICLGKAMANGLPISVVGGKKEIMNCKEYFVSSTFAGETVAMAAAIKTIELLTNHYSIDELWSAGERFQKLFNELDSRLQIVGYPTRGVLAGEEHIKALFMQEACKAGILFGPSWFFNFEHFAHTETVISTCHDIFQSIQIGTVKLEGKPPQSPFAQKVREK